MVADVAHGGVADLRGPTLDGMGACLREELEESPLLPVDVTGHLRRTDAGSGA